MTHELIEGAIVFALAFLACIAAIGVFVAMYNYYMEGPGWSGGVDLVGSQYVSADGKRFDWTKGDATNNGTPRNARAKNEGDDDPEEWKQVQYDEEGNYEIIPAQGEQRPHSEIELEVQDGDNRS